MIRFETEQTIDRSAEDVWAYAADITRHHEWMGVQDARLVSGRPTEVGARAIERMKLGPLKLDVEFEVSEAIPTKRIAWRTNGDGPLAADVSLELEALGADLTRAVWSGSIGLTRWWRFVEPLMAAEVKAGEAGELRRLKERLEMTTALASTTV